MRGEKALTNFDIKMYNIRAISNGDTDEEAIYQSKYTVEPIDTLEELRKIIGTPKYFEGIIRNGVMEGPPAEVVRQMPILVSAGNYIQEHRMGPRTSNNNNYNNVTLASSTLVQHDDDCVDTTLSLAIKRPANYLEYRITDQSGNNNNGEGS